MVEDDKMEEEEGKKKKELEEMATLRNTETPLICFRKYCGIFNNYVVCKYILHVFFQAHFTFS